MNIAYEQISYTEFYRQKILISLINRRPFKKAWNAKFTSFTSGIPPPPLDYKSNNYVSSKILGIRLVFTRGRPRLLSSPPFYNNQAGSPWYKIVPVFLTSFNPVWIPAPRRNLIYSRANYLFSQVRKTFAESKYSWAGLSWLIRRLIIID
jgi:hypothetical protein